MPFLKRKKPKTSSPKLPRSIDRLVVVKALFFIVLCVYGLRLFNLQVLGYSDYKAAADGEHIFYKKLLPQRGEILLRERDSESAVLSSLNTSTDRLFPAVTNRDY